MVVCNLLNEVIRIILDFCFLFRLVRILLFLLISIVNLFFTF